MDNSLDFSLAPSDELFTVEHFTNRGKENCVIITSCQNWAVAGTCPAR